MLDDEDGNRIVRGSRRAQLESACGPPVEAQIADRARRRGSGRPRSAGAAAAARDGGSRARR